VRCTQASAWHGSVAPESTGCTSLRVEVPSGSVEAPLEIVGRAEYGGIHASGVHVRALDLEAPFGLVADVTPTADAALRLWGTPLASGMCSSILRLPSDAAIAAVKLDVEHPEIRYADADPDDRRWWNGVDIVGFVDAPSVAPRTGSISWQRGTTPFAVGSAAVHASLGKAVLTTEPAPPADPFNNCQYQEPVGVELGSP